VVVHVWETDLAITVICWVCDRGVGRERREDSNACYWPLAGRKGLHCWEGGLEGVSRVRFEEEVVDQ